MKRNACWLSHGLCRPFVTSAATVLNSRVPARAALSELGELWVNNGSTERPRVTEVRRGTAGRKTRNFRRHADSSGDSSAFKNKSARARGCFPVKATYFQLIASRVVRVVMSRAYFLPSRRWRPLRNGIDVARQAVNARRDAARAPVAVESIPPWQPLYRARNSTAG